MAFVSSSVLPVRTQSTQKATCIRMQALTEDAQTVVNKYYPPYQRNRAPTITFSGQEGISLSMAPVEAFAQVDKDEKPLFDYSDETQFVPNKPVPPSDISWPSGDGRGKAIKSRKSFFEQPNLKVYGPFPDFYKRSCDG